MSRAKRAGDWREGARDVYERGGGYASFVRHDAPRIEASIRRHDARRRRGDAVEKRVELISLFARSYLPRTAEGSALVIRLTGWLRENADDLGAGLLDSLAARLDPRPTEEPDVVDGKEVASGGDRGADRSSRGGSTSRTPPRTNRRSLSGGARPREERE